MEIKMIDPDKPVTKPAFTSEPLTQEVSKTPNKFFLPLLVLVFLGLGVYSGILVKSSKTDGGALVGGSMSGIQADIPESGVKVGDIFGSPDEKAFDTTATGVLDKGGLNGEGTHKLVRPGGASQTVYLTSSVIDLDQLVNHQVTIWGETFKGQKTGWLMDVGRAKVETLNAPLPK